MDNSQAFAQHGVRPAHPCMVICKLQHEVVGGQFWAGRDPFGTAGFHCGARLDRLDRRPRLQFMLTCILTDADDVDLRIIIILTQIRDFSLCVYGPKSMA